LAQWKALIAFIKEWCEGVQDGQRVFTAALNRYQALDQFEQVLVQILLSVCCCPGEKALRILGDQDRGPNFRSGGCLSG